MRWPLFDSSPRTPSTAGGAHIFSTKIGRCSESQGNTSSRAGRSPFETSGLGSGRIAGQRA